jgi:acyl carrier protein
MEMNQQLEMSDMIGEIQSILELVTKRRWVGLDEATSFENLGIDSLDRIKTLVEIEKRFAVSLEESAAARVSSIRELVGLIAAARREAAGRKV